MEERIRTDVETLKLYTTENVHITYGNAQKMCTANLEKVAEVYNLKKTVGAESCSSVRFHFTCAGGLFLSVGVAGRAFQSIQRVTKVKEENF